MEGDGSPVRTASSLVDGTGVFVEERRAGRKRVVSDVFSCFYPWLIKDARLRRLVDDHGRWRAVRDRDARRALPPAMVAADRIFRPKRRVQRLVYSLCVASSHQFHEGGNMCFTASDRTRRNASLLADQRCGAVLALAFSRVCAAEAHQAARRGPPQAAALERMLAARVDAALSRGVRRRRADQHSVALDRRIASQ